MTEKNCKTKGAIQRPVSLTLSLESEIGQCIDMCWPPCVAVGAGKVKLGLCMGLGVYGKGGEASRGNYSRLGKAGCGCIWGQVGGGGR